MAKYSSTVQAKDRTALTTTEAETLTHEGAPAHLKDARTELFTLSVTSMTNEDAFYEDAAERDGRLRGLVGLLTVEDPGFIQKLVPYLRNTANMRSAPLVIAAEYALAGGPNRRQVIRAAMARADEPAEFVGYYMRRTGRKTLPAAIQRGVADAIRDLWTEYGVLKYDSNRHDLRMADVIELVHPGSRTDFDQGSLYQWILDRRHHGSDVRTSVETLPMIKARQELEAVEPAQRREILKAVQGKAPVASHEAIALAQDAFEKAGVTWEYLSGWIPGGMDAEAWEGVIPSMGYMALLRNLRNFDQAEISSDHVKYVKSVLEDPVQVAKSRQFPFRFWSAWRATESVEWGQVLETALHLSTSNIPEFEGTTLVLIDVSASMTNALISGRSTVTNANVAALFGAATFWKNPKTTRVAVFGSDSKDVTPKARGSILRIMDKFSLNHGVGHGTELAKAVMSQYQEEDRIVIFTDLQTHDGGASGKARFVHYFDLAGYSGVPDETGHGAFLYGGFTDATFRQMALHELTRTSDWDTILS